MSSIAAARAPWAGARIAPARESLREQRELRYRTQWHIPAFAGFAEAAGRRVLEIGCGDGADGVMFARHGARYTGIDSSPEALRRAREHFAAEGAEGELRQDDAQLLRFADASFDLVYAFDVLHALPLPWVAIDEIFRVLRPGGAAKVMLLHRSSAQYYGRILRAACTVLARRKSWSADRARLSKHLGEPFEPYYENFLREGWRGLSADRLAGVRACTKRDALALFARFSSARAWCAPGMGWQLLVHAVK